MAEPIGITFMPSADAAANGPRQAGIEGQGGSDLAEAFKILSLHLPRVLGASAIAPKRLLTSPGSAGVAAPAGVNPYSQVFEALLHSLGGGSMGPGGGYGPQSLASLFGGGDYGVPSMGGADPYSSASGGGYGASGAPAPVFVPGSELPRDGDVPQPASAPSYGGYNEPIANSREDTQYI